MIIFADDVRELLKYCEGNAPDLVGWSQKIPKIWVVESYGALKYTLSFSVEKKTDNKE